MSLRRIIVLLRKEVSLGAKNFIFIFAVVNPIVVSLVLSLVFGTLFSQKPKLGFADEGDSQIVERAANLEAISSQEYSSENALRNAVSRGTVDMGLVLPVNFDEQISSGELASVKAYVWGESLAQNRAILGAAIASLTRELTGQEIPVEVVITPLGDAEVIPWEDRLLPFIVLMGVIIGGTMVPASSLVDEKQKGTLVALTITPSSLNEVFFIKGIMGVVLSTMMGVLILILNQAFNGERLLLVSVLALGATLASMFGVMLGAIIKDITTLFTVIKGIGILLYAPGIVYLFPSLPQWIARIFPTYYIVGPVIEITQNGGGWSDVALDVLILVGLILLLLTGLLLISRRSHQIAYA